MVAVRRRSPDPGSSRRGDEIRAVPRGTWSATGPGSLRRRTRAGSGRRPVMAEMAIAEHGLIGDLQTAALVTTDGAVDWFCYPRFDSPSVFGALLDDERGGRFRIRPAGTGYQTKQMYFPDT